MKNKKEETIYNILTFSKMAATPQKIWLPANVFTKGVSLVHHHHMSFWTLNENSKKFGILKNMGVAGLFRPVLEKMTKVIFRNFKWRHWGM